jgi:hypothetical protein
MTTTTYTTKTTPAVTLLLNDDHNAYGHCTSVYGTNVDTGDKVWLGSIHHHDNKHVREQHDPNYGDYTARLANWSTADNVHTFIDALEMLWARTIEKNVKQHRMITDVTYAHELAVQAAEEKAMFEARRIAAGIAHDEAVSKFVEPTWNGKWFTQNQAKARVTDGLKQIKDLPSRRKIEIGSRTYQHQWCFAGTTDEMLDWYNGDYMEKVINACDDLEDHDTVSGSFCGTNKDMRRQGSFVHVYVYEWDNDWSLYDVHVIWLGTETEPAKHVGR